MNKFKKGDYVYCIDNDRASKKSGYILEIGNKYKIKHISHENIILENDPQEIPWMSSRFISAEFPLSRLEKAIYGIL